MDYGDYGRTNVSLTEEMEKRLPYTLLRNSNVEAFTNIYPIFQTDVSNIPQNIEVIQNIQNDLIQTQDILLNTYTDLSNNIDIYNSKTKFLQKNNDKYHYNDLQDPNVILKPEESMDIKTAIIHDVNALKLYQNSMYITTAIAAATFLIAAIILTKK